MRFLSPNSNYSIQVIEGKEVRDNDPVTGQSYTRTERQPFVANFESGHGLFPHEVEIALEKFAGNFKGLPENVNPVTRISVFDTEAHAIFAAWTPEYHKAIADRMVALAESRPDRMVAVPEKWHARPFPEYDNMDVEEILAALKFTGIDPESVRLYEGENLNRPDLMQTLDNLGSGTLSEEPAEHEVMAVVSA